MSQIKREGQGEKKEDGGDKNQDTIFAFPYFPKAMLFPWETQDEIHSYLLVGF